MANAFILQSYLLALSNILMEVVSTPIVHFWFNTHTTHTWIHMNAHTYTQT